MSKKHLIVMLVSFCLLSACEEPVQLPKKHGFPRMDIPVQTEYQLMQSATCPFEFEIPVEGEVTRDLTDSCWMDVQFDRYNITWHISHRDARLTGRTADFHFEEHRKLVYKHSQKATEIRPFDYDVPAGSVTAHELFGEVGSPYYLFLRDSSNTQVVTMAIYFQTSLKNDSLAPMISYMKKQLDHTANTLKFTR